ncbi:MAG: alkaline phosphatase [Proteiniphilum sp.]
MAKTFESTDSNKETLVIETAGHKIRGLTLIDGDTETGLVLGYHVIDDHTSTMIPVFAYSPNSKNFSGVYNNTEIFHKMKELLNL